MLLLRSRNITHVTCRKYLCVHNKEANETYGQCTVKLPILHSNGCVISWCLFVLLTSEYFPNNVNKLKYSNHFLSFPPFQPGTN